MKLLSIPITLLSCGVLALMLNSCDIETFDKIVDEISVELGTKQIEAVDSAVRAEMRLQNLPGLAVAVIQDGEITHVNGYGYQDEDKQVPVTVDTEFRWASISKTFTAAMAMRLHEAGHLDLDKDVRDYVSAWPNKGVTITTRQLLSNTGGIPDYDQCSGWSGRRNSYLRIYPNTYDPLGALDIFNVCGMQTVGTYNYATFGFLLAGAAIDKAGRDAGWGDFEDQALALADSLGMSSMALDRMSSSGSQKTDGFDIDCNGALQNIEDEEDVIYKVPGGGFRSNIKDIARFCRDMVDPQVLSDSLWDRMLTPVHNDGWYGYGLGTQHFALGRTHERYGHGGTQDEARTQMLFYPNHNTAIILLCSSHFVDRERLRNRVAQATGISISPGTYNYQSQINCASSCATDQDPLFAGAWEKSTKDQLLRRGLTTDAFNAEWQDLSDSGYRLTDIETWTDDEGRRRWDGIFVEGSGRHALWRNFNQDGFKEKWDEMTEDGLHLIDLETYEVNGSRRWAGVFREGSGGSALWRNFDTQGFNEKWQEMSDQGLRLIDLETYVDGGQRKWAGAFVAGGGRHAMWRNFSTSDFGTKRNEMKAQGLKLIDLETYKVNGQRRWAGVWREDSQQEWLNRNQGFCQFLDRDSTWKAGGHILMEYEVYEP